MKGYDYLSYSVINLPDGFDGEELFKGMRVNTKNKFCSLSCAHKHFAKGFLSIEKIGDISNG